MADHFAHDDFEALQITRDIVANLNWKKQTAAQSLFGAGSAEVEEPLYPAEELYGIIPSDAKQPFDIRAV